MELHLFVVVAEFLFGFVPLLRYPDPTRCPSADVADRLFQSCKIQSAVMYVGQNVDLELI